MSASPVTGLAESISNPHSAQCQGPSASCSMVCVCVSVPLSPPWPPSSSGPSRSQWRPGSLGWSTLTEGGWRDLVGQEQKVGGKAFGSHSGHILVLRGPPISRQETLSDLPWEPLYPVLRTCGLTDSK